MFFDKWLGLGAPSDSRPVASHFEPRADCDNNDPYLRDSTEQRALAQGARLAGSADGNPAAVLNMVSVGTSAKRRRAA